MTPTRPHRAFGRSVMIGKNQPQYMPLPAGIDDEGVVTTIWEPDAEELAELMDGGYVVLQIHTFNRPIQPVRVAILNKRQGQ